MAKNIRQLVATVLHKNDNWKIQLLSNWPIIIGNLSAHVHIEKIKDDTIIVGVQDSCWLQELYLLSPILLKTINETLDQARIKHLRFKTRGIKQAKQPQPVQPTTKKNIKPVRLSVRERKALERIKDPQLSLALKNFLIRCYQENP